MYKIFHFLTILSFLLCLVGCEQKTTITDDEKPPLPPPVQEEIASHPRLLLKQGEETKIKSIIQKAPGMMAAHQYIIDFSDKVLQKPPVERVLIGKRLLAVSNEALRRIYFLSYSYRMTNDKKYAQRVEKELEAVCEFEDWNPSHFLDVAEMTTAVAIGYDWLFDYLSDSVRKKVRKAILDKAFKPAKDTKKAWFYTAVNNWNQVCNAGLVLGALAIYEDEPEMAKEMIQKSVASVPLAMDSYGPDGAYPEGFSYWGYGTGFEVTMLASLESALGTDFKLSENKSFMRSPYFMLFMTAPTGSCYNFSDSGRKINLQQAMYWFAAKSNDLSLLFYECKYLSNLANYVGNDNDRLLPNILIFSKDIDLSRIEEPKDHFWLSHGIKPLFIYRSGWGNENETYLGVVGGSASTSHGHMDAGSFVYEKKGIRWAMELGLQSYGTLESKGVDLWNSSQDGQRWDVFRLGNTGHSTLVINKERHLVSGDPQIIHSFQTNECKGAELDLSSLFANSLSKSIRKVTLDSKNDLLVCDKITTNGTSAEVMWLMVTPAKAKIVGDKQIELSKDGHKMLLTVESPVAIEMKIWSNKPVHSYDQDNPGTLRVGFETVLPANSAVELSVKLSTLN